jgi:hypothetical protein
MKSKLTKEQWARCRERREIGASYPALAKEFGVSYQAIQKRATQENWADGYDVRPIIKRQIEEKSADINLDDLTSEERKAHLIDMESTKGAAKIGEHRIEGNRIGKMILDAIAIKETNPKQFAEDMRTILVMANAYQAKHNIERKAWWLDETNIDKKACTVDQLKYMLTTGRRAPGV